MDTVRREGVIVATEAGSKPNPALVEARQQAIVLARVLAALRLPAGDESEGRPQRRVDVRGSTGRAVPLVASSAGVVRRKDPPSPVDDDGPVPDWWRCFDSRDERWHDPADDGAEWVDRGVCRRRRWHGARCLWAIAHGFDVAAVHGTKPGHDWWRSRRPWAEKRLTPLR